MLTLGLICISPTQNFSVLQKGTCRYSVQGKAGSCSSFHVLPHGDEETLKVVVARVGPVAVAVNAMLASFHLYRGGEVSEEPVRRVVDASFKPTSGEPVEAAASAR